MRALVLLRQVLDVTLPFDLADGQGLRLKGSPPIRILNRADRAALEWACRLCETDVTALTVAPAESDETLSLARARGARRVIRCWAPEMAELDATALSLLLVAATQRLQPDLIFAGDRSLEGSTGLVPALLAARLDWPCLEGAADVARDGGGVLIRRRLDRGWQEEIEASPPAVITVEAGSIEPRYVSARARRAAASIAAECWGFEELGVDPAAIRESTRCRVTALSWPRPRPKKVELPSAALSAADRMRQLMGGGAAPKKAVEAKLLEVDPPAAAERLIAFLSERGLV
jgi:electron transfer flavoprotein beta subunit